MIQMNKNINIWDTLNDYVDKKLLTMQKHPEFDYYIFNYTQKVQFEKLWDEVTLSCRGLILDSKGKVIARPFDKFFNYEEIKDRENISFDDCMCYEKADGSLGIAYLTPNDEVAFATRGSFTSEQALEALKIYNTTFTDTEKLVLADRLRDGFTELFEIIYPENKIVVDYKGRRMLRYLGTINKNTKEFFFLPEVYSYYVTKFKLMDSIDFLKKHISPGEEGFVLRTKVGQVFKLKSEEYLRLHKLMTEVNSKNIWEALSNGTSIDDFLENVPDEFYSWVKKTKEKMEEDFRQLYNTVYVIYENEFKNFVGERKDMAIKITTNYKDYAGMLFGLIDNKPIDKAIWKMLKPKTIEKPFVFREEE